MNDKNCLTATSLENVLIKNLAIEFNITSQTTADGIGIQMVNCRNCQIDTVKISNAGSHGIDCNGLKSGATEQLHLISNCYVDDPGKYGIWLRSTGTDDIGRTIVKNCYIHNAGYSLETNYGRGIEIAGLSSCIIENNTVDGATEFGIRLFSNTTYKNCNNNTISNNLVRNIGSDSVRNAYVYSIYLYAESTGETLSNVVNGNHIEDIGCKGNNDIGITCGGSDNNFISGNIISGTQGKGINLSTYTGGVNEICNNSISNITEGIRSSYNSSNGDHYKDKIEGNYGHL